MKRTTSRTLIVLALAATLLLVWFAPGDEDDLAAPSAAKARRARPASTRPATEVPLPKAAGALQGVERAPLAEPIIDLFAASSWYVPPPAPKLAPPPPPPPPTAPPLPFAYLGQYLEGNNRIILLTRGDRLLSVAPGEVIDRTYRVGTIQNGQLSFTYLPMQIEQSLTTGVSP